MHVALRRAEEACEGELTWDRLHVIVGSAPRGWVEMCAQGADAAPGAHVCGVLWESAVAVRTPHRPRPRSVWTMRVVIYNIHLCTGPFFLTRARFNLLAPLHHCAARSAWQAPSVRPV